MAARMKAMLRAGLVGVSKWLLPALILGASAYLVLDAVSVLASSGGLQYLQPAWNPSRQVYGVGVLVVCTLLAAVPATLLAVTVATPCALALVRQGSSRLVRLARISLGVWSGAPSIVVGVLVLSVLTPVAGFSLLAGVVALTCMILPGLALSLEALLKNADKSRYQVLKAHGFGPVSCLRHGLWPEVKGTATALVLLTLARALGEATAVSLVIGGVVAAFPPGVFGGAETLATAVLKGFPVADGPYMAAISVTAATLLFLIAACVAAAALVRRRWKEGE